MKNLIFQRAKAFYFTFYRSYDNKLYIGKVFLIKNQVFLVTTTINLKDIYVALVTTILATKNNSSNA